MFPQRWGPSYCIPWLNVRRKHRQRELRGWEYSNSQKSLNTIEEKWFYGQEQPSTVHSTHSKKEINNKNSSTPSIEPYFIVQREKHESEGVNSASEGKAKQNTSLEFSQSIEATTTGEKTKHNRRKMWSTSRALTGTIWGCTQQPHQRTHDQYYTLV